MVDAFLSVTLSLSVVHHECFRRTGLCGEIQDCRSIRSVLVNLYDILPFSEKATYYLLITIKLSNLSVAAKDDRIHCLVREHRMQVLSALDRQHQSLTDTL